MHDLQLNALEEDIVKLLKFFLFVLYLFPMLLYARDDVDGRWDFIKSAQYTPNRGSEVPLPLLLNIDVMDNETNLNKRAHIYFTSPKDAKEKVFSPLINAGEAIDDIERFLQRNFNIALSEVKAYYILNKPHYDEAIGEAAFVTTDKLVIVKSGAVFYQYHKPEIRTFKLPQSLGADVYKIASLPFSSRNYSSLCLRRLYGARGMQFVRAVNKCAPTYHPYVASKKSRDSLGKIVGAHNYLPNSDSGYSYNNPVSNGYHPVFLVFPPLKDVILVRVTDMEQGEFYDRDVGFGGAYLSIKNGKVVGQVDPDCDFDEKYVCKTEKGLPIVQLLETGEFKNLKGSK